MTDKMATNATPPEPTSDTTTFKLKQQKYLSLKGSYCRWRTDVNLRPSDPYTPVPPEDSVIHRYYYNLQYMLYEIGFPETKDKSDRPIKYPADRVTIVVMANPIDVLGMLLEGGRQCPNDMLLVLSTSWLTKTPVDSDSNLYALYVHKALAFKSGGRSTITVYDPPRRVTYLINFFNSTNTGGTRDDGRLIEMNLECQVGSPAKLAYLVDDKVWTRIRMAEYGVGVPETLAFAYRSKRNYSSDVTTVKVISLESKQNVENMMLNEIQNFINSPFMQRHNQIVVKPSGVMWMGSLGVTFHAKTDVMSIWKAALALLNELLETDAILVEAFRYTVKPCGNVDFSWRATTRNAARYRATVVRGVDNRSHFVKIVCGTGFKKDPVNSINTVTQSLDSTLLAFGVTDVEVRRKAYASIARSAEAVLDSIINYEAKFTPAEVGARRGRTDLVGIDFILSLDVDGELQPVAVEVNSLQCTTNCDLYEFLFRETMGEAFQTFVETMISYSQYYLMAGRSVCALVTTMESASLLIEFAQQCEIHILLVLLDTIDKFELSRIQSTSYVSYVRNNDVETDAHGVVAAVQKQCSAVEGCFTLDIDLVPLCAHVCSLLGRQSVNANGALLASDIDAMQNLLASRDAIIPHWPLPYLYSIYHTHNGCTDGYFDVVEDGERNDESVACCINGEQGVSSSNFTSSAYHHVIVVMFECKLIGAFVADHDVDPLQHCSVFRVPTSLPDDKRDQLKIAAYQCCNEIVLQSGVFGVDLTFNSITAKLIKVTPCLTNWQVRDTVRTLYGVDLLHCALMIACGVRPVLPVAHSFQHLLQARCASFGSQRHEAMVQLTSPSKHCDDLSCHVKPMKSTPVQNGDTLHAPCE